MDRKQIESQMANWLNEGFHCSQCVMRYWAGEMGMDESFALKLTSGLGLGVNHGDSCGALTATALALGLSYGFVSVSDSGAAGGIEEIVRKVENEFVTKNGSTLCRNLLNGGYDGADPNAKAVDGVDPWEHCHEYCADVIEMASAYLESADEATWKNAPVKQGNPSPALVGSGCGIAGLIAGVSIAGVIAYEKRRAENERD